ncbi:unnamed protein product [Gadus morhua 'NCC']
MEKKRKGGAEKVRDKKRKALEANSATCAKISDMFAATAGPASLAPASVEIATAEAEEDDGDDVDGEVTEWRPRPSAEMGGAGGGPAPGPSSASDEVAAVAFHVCSFCFISTKVHAAFCLSIWCHFYLLCYNLVCSS